MRWTLALLLWAVSLQGAPRVRDWTVLVYLAADEAEVLQASRNILKQMEAVPGLSADGDVAVVAEIDEAGEDPNHRYVLAHVASPSKDLVDTPPVPEAEIRSVDPGFRYGEKDSGSPLTLKAFLRWGVRAYPARHYVLVLGGHSWGQQGLLQDFYVDGEALETSTMLKNYELRRLLEETYLENRDLIPRGRFDALVVDACVYGHLDILLELEHVADYLGATQIEVPYASFPYDRILGGFLQGRREGLTGHRLLEERFLKPLVREYVLAHSPGGSLVKAEGLADPVQYFVLRTEGLAAVAKALKRVVRTMPRWLRRQFTAGKLEAVQAVADGDGNADLLQLGRVLGNLYRREGEEEAREAADALVESLGYGVPDPSMRKTHLRHPRAEGAWAHVEVDSYGSWQVAACVGLRSFTLMNALAARESLPVVTNGEGKKVSFGKVYCADLLAEMPNPEAELPDGQAVSLDGILGHKLGWPSHPATITQWEGKRRVLSVWVDRGRRKTLDRKVFLRLPASTAVETEYVVAGKKEKGSTERFAPYALFEDFDNRLYVAEGHNHGTHFKHGLGIYLGRDFSGAEQYQVGRIPVEKVEPYPHAWTLEQYESWFRRQKELGQAERFFRSGFDLYRLHRFQKLTRWSDFLEGK